MKESNFVKLIRKHMTIYHWYRIETTTVLGFPDMIGIAPQMDTLFVETKITRSGRLNLVLIKLLCPKEYQNNLINVYVFDELAKLFTEREKFYMGSTWEICKKTCKTYQYYGWMGQHPRILIKKHRKCQSSLR